MSRWLIYPTVLSAILSAAVLPPAVLAKGTEDNPTVVQIDPSANDVDANVTNEVEIKNDTGNLAVKIANGAGEAIPVDDGTLARIPFVHSDYANGQLGFSDDFEIPGSGIAVIETINIAVLNVFDDSFLNYLAIGTAGVPGGEIEHAVYFLPAHREQVVSNKSQYIAYETGRIYMPAGTRVSISGQMYAGHNADFSWSISGYVTPSLDPSLSP